MDTPWRIEMLGRLRSVQGDRAVFRFRTQKTGALLAYLAHHLHRDHPREALIEVFWPEMPLSAGRNNLSKALTSLRHQLEPPGLPADSVIVSDNAHVRLNPAAVTTDVGEFEASLERARKAADDRQRMQHLTEAARLYRGELLPGYSDDWVLLARQHLAEAFSEALSRLIALLERNGDLGQAVQWSRRAVATDPLREEAHHTLIRLLIATNQPDAARRQYEDLARRLEQDLGLTPSPEVRALVFAHTRGSPGPTQPSGAGGTRSPTLGCPPARSPGAHTGAADGHTKPEDPVSPPLHPIGSPAGNLPLQFTRFFGREEEIAHLQELLLDEEVRLVTLTGAGGSGKTRLAVQTAMGLREHYANSVWFLALEEVNDSRLIVDRMLETLHLTRSADLEPLGQVSARLSRGPALLVVDNFEHLVTEGAALVRSLLGKTATLTCLITSRQSLNLPEEREFPVSPLPVPVAPPETGGEARPDTRHHSPAILLQCASVQLFVDRAQAVQPDFQVTQRNGPAVATLCARLEGIPLAIELAASRSRVLTPAQMVARLDQRFALLVRHRRAVTPRHQSLRATLDWSNQLLTQELQQFFHRLSVFRGGWTVEAAEAVCSEPRALDYLEELREASLVITTARGAEMRYRLLETVREYGAAQLDVDEQADLAQRHAGYFQALAEAADARIRSTQQPFWMEQLEREHDNLRAALDWLTNAGEAAPGGLESADGLCLAGAIGWFWFVRGYFAEGRERLTRLLALTETDERTPSRGRALEMTGWLAWGQGDLEVAGDLLSKSVGLWRELDGKEGLAWALVGLGWVADYRNQHETARDLREESVRLMEEVGNTWGFAVSNHCLGRSKLHLGDPAAAKRHHEQSLAIFQKTNDRSGMARCLLGLGHVACQCGDDDAALAFFAESATLRRELGEKLPLGNALECYAWAALRQGNASAARAAFLETLLLRHELGNRGEVSTILAQLAGIDAQQGQHERAALLLGAAQSLRDSVGASSLSQEQMEATARLSALRRELGDATCTAAWEAGHAMTCEQAIATAGA